jgi:hypothetical protein
MIMLDIIITGTFAPLSSFCDIAHPIIWKFQTKLGLFPSGVFPRYQPICPKYPKPHIDAFFRLDCCPL